MVQYDMLTLQYIAGLVDGEGSIGIINRMISGRQMLDPYLHINICHEDVLNQVQQTLGIGKVYKENRQTKGHLDCYMYACNNRGDIEVALERLIPYLVVKKQAAELIHEYCHNRIPHTPYTERELMLWLAQYVLQHKHNHNTKLS